VKHGDPLSPWLFGLLIDRNERALEERLSEAGALVKGRRLVDLLYKDNLNLIVAANIGGAQGVLRAC
jgi:hypothetical protein